MGVIPGRGEHEGQDSTTTPQFVCNLPFSLSSMSLKSFCGSNVSVFFPFVFLLHDVTIFFHGMEIAYNI